jgi:hypothetical protein
LAVVVAAVVVSGKKIFLSLTSIGILGVHSTLAAKCTLRHCKLSQPGSCVSLSRLRLDSRRIGRTQCGPLTSSRRTLLGSRGHRPPLLGQHWLLCRVVRGGGGGGGGHCQQLFSAVFHPF